MTHIEVVKNARNSEFLKWIYSTSQGNKEIEKALVSNAETPFEILKSIYSRGALERRKHTEKKRNCALNLKNFNLGA